MNLIGKSYQQNTEDVMVILMNAHEINQNENEYTTFQALWDTMKAIFRRTFIELTYQNLTDLAIY